MQTWRYMLKRILLAVISIFAIITITYFLMNLMPGDPFMSEKASEENRAILIAKYGLDQPVYVQYGRYLENLFHGDMGTSYVLQKGRAVKDIIAESFKVSKSTDPCCDLRYYFGMYCRTLQRQIAGCHYPCIVICRYIHAGICHRIRIDDAVGSQSENFTGKL